jgi:hypothetical protein
MIDVIFKGGHGAHSTIWWAAGWTPVIYVIRFPEGQTGESENLPKTIFFWKSASVCYESAFISHNMQKYMLWFGRWVAGLLQHKPRFNSSYVKIRFVVNKVTLDRCLSQFFGRPLPLYFRQCSTLIFTKSTSGQNINNISLCSENRQQWTEEPCTDPKCSASLLSCIISKFLFP